MNSAISVLKRPTGYTVRVTADDGIIEFLDLDGEYFTRGQAERLAELIEAFEFQRVCERDN